MSSKNVSVAKSSVHDGDCGAGSVHDEDCGVGSVPDKDCGAGSRHGQMGLQKLSMIAKSLIFFYKKTKLHKSLIL